ncbi:type II secretion system protein N [Vibrio hangzhouensis]|uniref:Type II secretion system protein N n=1 Tax=Vibrio hangzhouensis TaxID=462991 RepID=A0A1H6ARN2_9VIBR|nr:type II secretion system protein N [Vibrio hangzhouensis]SEG50747.1 general secretion pathway protein N [Vibrio hangzhouensis]
MKRVTKYALLCTGVFTASAIYHLPARVAISYLPLPIGLSVDGAQGTLWQGSAQDVRFQRYQLGELTWSFSWASLLTFSPEYALRFGRGSALGVAGKGNVGMSFSGPYVDSLLASIPAETALQLAPLPLPVSAGGQLELAINSLQYQAPWCSAGNGSLSWNAGYVETPMGSLRFGPTIVDLACSDSVLSAKGSQSSQQISSEFSGQLSPNRQYQSTAWFKPEGEFPATMRQQLGWLGNPDSQGRYSFNYQGRF